MFFFTLQDGRVQCIYIITKSLVSVRMESKIFKRGDKACCGKSAGVSDVDPHLAVISVYVVASGFEDTDKAVSECTG